MTMFLAIYWVLYLLPSHTSCGTMKAEELFKDGSREFWIRPYPWPPIKDSIRAVLPSFLFQQFNAFYPFSAPTTSKLIFMASSFHHFRAALRRKRGSWEPPRYCFGSKETTWGFQRMRDGPLAIRKTTCCQIYRIGRPIANGFYQKKEHFAKIDRTRDCATFRNAMGCLTGDDFCKFILSHQIYIDFQGFVAYEGGSLGGRSPTRCSLWKLATSRSWRCCWCNRCRARL